jgi:hypothetical protein
MVMSFKADQFKGLMPFHEVAVGQRADQKVGVDLAVVLILVHVAQAAARCIHLLHTHLLLLLGI